jgi:hypothetical protein
LANRSSFSSSLPRDIKRLIDCTPGTDSYIRELRNLFVDAHAHHRKWHSAMLIQKSNVDMSTEEPTSDIVASVSTT